MPSTITAFYEFQKKQPAVGSEVSTNFANFRGTRLPIAEDTATTSDLEHSVGTEEHRWKSIGIEEINIVNTATGVLTLGTRQRPLFASAYNVAGTAASSGFQWTWNGTTGSYAMVGVTGTFSAVPGWSVQFAYSTGCKLAEIQVIGTCRGTVLNQSSPIGLAIDGSGGGAQVVLGALRFSQYQWNISGGGTLPGAFPFSWTIHLRYADLPAAAQNTTVSYAIYARNLTSTALTFENYFIRMREVR